MSDFSAEPSSKTRADATAANSAALNAWPLVNPSWTNGIPGQVLVMGDIMLDRYWFGDVHRISPEAPVPVVNIERTQDRLGGAANVARNICSLGGQATLIGVVGDDEAGRSLAALAATAQINWQAQIQPDYLTILKTRIMGRNQQLLRVDCEQMCPASAMTPLREAVVKHLTVAPVIIFSDYAKGALHEVEPLIAMARAAGKFVLVDPKDEDFGRYAGADVLTPNLREFKAAVGNWRTEESFIDKAHALRQHLKLTALLITRSEQGMSLFTADGVDHIPAVAHEVFDVSGAGDTVIGTLGLCMASGLDLHQAVRWANVAAGIVVGKVGTSVVSFRELSFAGKPKL